MSIVIYPLLFLPAHHYSREKYYQKRDEWIEQQKSKAVDQWGMTYDQLSEGTQMSLREHWYKQWPFWKFNNIVGYVDIGMDAGYSMAADIYLKRKYFPRDARERQNRDDSGLIKNQFLFYDEISRVSVGQRDNDSYLSAFEEVVNRAKRKLKRRNRDFKLWLPKFNFSCFDFVEAHRQARNNRT